MADCRECAGCLDVVEGVRILCVDSPMEPVMWMEALHDQCDDFRQKTAPAVDCRSCEHGYNFEPGLGYRCAKAEVRFPWEHVASDPCDEFQPKPADSPPASADREGPDLLEAAKAIRQYVHGNYTWDSTYSRAFDAFKRAISSEEARRARPAVEDPRDATIRDLRALVGRYATALVEIAREDHDFDRIEAIARAVLAGDSGVLDPRCALLQRCAAALSALDGCVLWSDEQDWHLHGRLRTSAALAACRDTLASLRAAGVEPAPEAQEGKATP